MKKAISEVKAELLKGECSKAISVLNQILEKSEIKIIKEQKIIVKAGYLSDSSHVFEAYLEAAKRILDDRELAFVSNYIEFVKVYIDKCCLLQRTLEEICLTDNLVKTNEVLPAFDELHKEYSKFLYSNFNKYHKDNLSSLFNADEVEHEVAVNEHFLHKLNGMSNDFLYAAARALLVYLKVENQYKRKLTKSLYQELIRLSSLLNTLDYVMDGISYGEFNVAEIRKSESIISFMLAPVSVNAMKAKELGIRRELSNHFRPKRTPREIRTLFKKFTEEVFNHILNAKVKNLKINISNYQKDKLYLEVDELLDKLNIEDEILLSAGSAHSIIPVSYLVVITAYIYAIISNYIIESARINNISRQSLYCLQKNEIKYLVVKYSVFDQSKVEEAMSLVFVDYQDLNPIDFVKCSFVAHKTAILNIPSILNSNWSTWVRAKLVNGGPIANFYGDLWEQYISYVFADYGWIVLSRNDTYKKDGKHVTDTDVIVAKDDLILLIQIKAFAGGEQGLYDIWKIRKVIDNGKDQARLSNKKLVDENFIDNILNESKYPNKINKVIPIVLTNSHCNYGYSIDDVQVLSLASLMTILNGANVKYFDKNMSLVKECPMTQGPTLTSTDILNLLQTPIDFRLASTSQTYHYIETNVDNIRFMIPSFT